MDKNANTDKWITMRGRHVLMKSGETPEQALARSEKEFAKGESDRRDKEIAEREKNTKQLTADNAIPKSYKKDGITYSVKRGKDGVYLHMKDSKGNESKTKINSPNDPKKANVKLTGKGLVYLSKDPNMLKLLEN